MTTNVLKKNRLKGIIAAIVASVLWSTGGILIKLVDLNPVAISGYRSLVASIVLFSYIKKPNFTKSKPQILGSISYAAVVLLFVMANKLTTSANAILLQFTAPIFVAILGVKILKEKIHWYDLVAIIVVFFGMILFFINSVDSGNTLGNILAIISGFCLACFTISIRLQKDGSAFETTLFGNILTFIVAIPFMVTSIPNGRTMLILIIMGVFQLGIPYIFYVYSMKHLAALEAILITVLEPLLNPVWVFIFMGEKPGMFSLIGGAIVISAVIIRGIYISKWVLIEVEGG